MSAYTEMGTAASAKGIVILDSNWKTKATLNFRFYYFAV